MSVGRSALDIAHCNHWCEPHDHEMLFNSDTIATEFDSSLFKINNNMVYYRATLINTNQNNTVK